MTADDGAIGLRERKKQTRVALSQATIRLTLERGRADVTVEHWLRTDPTGSVVPFLREAFDRITAGLPVP